MTTDSLSELLSRQVDATPDAVAAIFGDDHLTYSAMSRQARRVACALRTRGIEAETTVGICLPPSLDLLTCLLGVIEAGGAFVPIDQNWPAQRREAVLTASRVRLLISNEGFKASDAHPALLVTTPAELSAECSAGMSCPTSDAGLLAILFTSGTTARPKGVLLTSGGVTAQILKILQKCPYQDGDVNLLHRSFASVGFFREWLGPLFSGATLIVVPENEAKDPASLLSLATRHHVTQMSATPAMWDAVLDYVDRHPAEWASLRIGRVGADQVEDRLLSRWRQTFPGARLWNCYGCTECTSACTHDATGSGTVSDIDAAREGLPGNEGLHILDHRLRPVPAGRSGEIYLGGRGIARGYLESAANTALRFVPSPVAGEQGQRLLRTGDVGVLHSRHVLIIGRRDNRVKVRGFRVELEEIEAVLKAQPGVHDAAVVARSDKRNQTELVGFVVPTESALPPTSTTLRRALLDIMAEYQVPAHFSIIDALPRTALGKLDRASLSATSASEVPSVEADWSLSPFEISMKDIWCDVLRVKHVAAQDSFFDIGGNSIAAMQMLCKVCDMFGVTLSFACIFDYPTLRDFARVAYNAVATKEA
ncbi:MAG: hypothetical protein DMG02_00365 [Acidobacteria bacterium]|nr:MAG: hypothetical protein DMG02_00365 [Acidobacteriota bacterium]